MNIPKDIQKEWDDHLSDIKIMIGLPKFISKANYNLLEFSSTLFHYALGVALKEHPPVGLPYLYSEFIKAYMFMNYILDDYLSLGDREKLFLKYLKSELEESKVHMQTVHDHYTHRFIDR